MHDAACESQIWCEILLLLGMLVPSNEQRRSNLIDPSTL